MTEKALTIYCHCSYYQIVPDSVKSQVLDAIKAAGVKFEAVPDLCRMCARRDPRLRQWASAGALAIFACYPRAVRWLFHAGGAPLPKEGVEFVNMRNATVEEMVRSLDEDAMTAATAGEVRLEKEGDWIPWFPVIDYDRCENCKQCFGFCLFGVYELCEDGRVEVRNPANCKTNCPACARACPSSAIIFPKYADAPINGDEVAEEVSRGTEAKANLTELLGGDVYDAIRRRSRGGARFSAGAEAGAEPSQQHKSSTMKELQEKLAIPPEVLASLSPAEMAGLRTKAAKQDRSNAQPSSKSSQPAERRNDD